MAKTLSSTPKQDGYYMPAEWAPHKQCWLIWPEKQEAFRNGAKPAQKVMAELCEHIADYEDVTMLVSKSQFKNCRNRLSKRIRVIEMTTDDTWSRDFLPSFVVDGKGGVRGVHWGFDAYANTFYPYDQCAVAGQKVLEIENMDRYVSSLIMEGGAFGVDGEGTLIATLESTVDRGSNPDLTREDYERSFADYLGISKVIWIKRGLAGDPTSGHIDELAAFIKPAVVVLYWTDDENDPQYEICREAYETLSNATDVKGRRLEVHKIVSEQVDRVEGELDSIDIIDDCITMDEYDLSASYINHYFTNGAIIIPQYGCEKADAAAIEAYQKLLPDYKVIGLKDAREFAMSGGCIHCMTQQQPK